MEWGDLFNHILQGYFTSTGWFDCPNSNEGILNSELLDLDDYLSWQNI